ncbi:MAG: hypothetical protein IT374_25510 [Polyangiaceae bacterium]|nr:hypothetical protein [Polyangiaceae bacterium]
MSSWSEAPSTCAITLSSVVPLQRLGETFAAQRRMASESAWVGTRPVTIPPVIAR